MSRVANLLSGTTSQSFSKRVAQKSCWKHVTPPVIALGRKCRSLWSHRKREEAINDFREFPSGDEGDRWPGPLGAVAAGIRAQRHFGLSFFGAMKFKATGITGKSREAQDDDQGGLPAAYRSAARQSILGKRMLRSGPAQIL